MLWKMLLQVANVSFLCAKDVTLVPGVHYGGEVEVVKRNSL